MTDSAKVTSKAVKLKNVPDEAVPDLIRLVHGNINNKVFLAKEFIAFWNKQTGSEAEGNEDNSATPSTKGSSGLSKKKVIDKIQEIAEYKKNPEAVGRCWMVKEEFLTKYEISSSATNEWKYLLEQPNKTGASEDVPGSRPESPSNKTVASPAPTNLLMDRYMKVLTEEEKEEKRIKLEKEAAAASFSSLILFSSFSSSVSTFM